MDKESHEDLDSPGFLIKEIESLGTNLSAKKSPYRALNNSNQNSGRESPKLEQFRDKIPEIHVL